MDKSYIDGGTSVFIISTFGTLSEDRSTPAPRAVVFSWTLPGEIWRPARILRNLQLKNLDGYYVSNLGRTCHHGRGILKTTTCNGHVYAWFGRKLPVGRVIVSTWWGQPQSPGAGVLYRDGDRGNLTPENLSWGQHVRISAPGVKGLRWRWGPLGK